MFLDVDSNIERLNSVDKKLRRFSFHVKLETIRKANHAIDRNYSNPFLIKSAFPGHSDQFYNRFSRYYHAHELAYLALMATVKGEWNGLLGNSIDYKTFGGILNDFRDYTPPFFHKNDKGILQPYETARLFLVRTALQQFGYQDNPIDGLYRYHKLFSFVNENLDVRQYFIKAFKYSFEDYVKFCVAIYLLSRRSHSPLTVNMIKKEYAKGTNFSPKKIEHMIKVLSMDRLTAIEKYNGYKFEDEKMRVYNYNPYLMKPFLKEGELIYLPIPLNMFKSITEGFYQMLCFQFKDFRALFGKYAYEEYIGELLTNLTTHTIIKEFPFKIKKQEQLTSDYMIVDKNDIILMELKANAPSIALRGTDFNSYKHELNKSYVKAIIQCIKKYKLIQDGYIVHENIPTTINRVSFLVVTLEEYYLIDHNIISRMIKDAGYDLNGIDYHIMGTPTLEQFLERDSRDLITILHDREKEGTVYNHLASADVKILKDSMKNTNSYLLWQKLILELAGELSSENK